MKRCAFLTMDSLEGYVHDDALAVAPLADLGWSVESLPWRQTARPWHEFDVVVIRSTWDYYRYADAFLEVLAEIAAATRLVNDLSLVRWNAHKRYLRDLERRGFAVVPTAWEAPLTAERLFALFDHFKTDDLVLKPALGANAEGAHRVSRRDQPLFDSIVASCAGRETLVQPFVPAVLSEGEYSVVFFSGAHSHTILKLPARSDFRVQEEHGGLVRLVPGEAALHEQARAIVASLSPLPLYARVDVVRFAPEKFALMELELVEPSLYLRLDEAAPGRFARAIAERFAST